MFSTSTIQRWSRSSNRLLKTRQRSARLLWSWTSKPAPQTNQNKHVTSSQRTILTSNSQAEQQSSPQSQFLAQDFTFFKAGGVPQLKLEKGKDLRAAYELDPKLFVALSCPVKNVNISTRLLELMDKDGNGKVRLPDVKATLAFALDHFNDLDTLMHSTKSYSSLALDRIDDSTPHGVLMLKTAKKILKNHDKEDAKEITPLDTKNAYVEMIQSPFNGDGVIEARHCDKQTSRVAQLIIDTVGGTSTINNELGVSQKKLDEFFQSLKLVQTAWNSAKEQQDEILPLGRNETQAAYESMLAIEKKVEDFFERCRLTAYDPGVPLTFFAVDELNRTRDLRELLASTKRVDVADSELQDMPLARASLGAALPLNEGLNPAYAKQMEAFRRDCVVPFSKIDGQVSDGDSGKTLSESQWRQLKHRLDPYRAWRKHLASNPLSALPRDEIDELLESPAKEVIGKLIEQDKAARDQVQAVRDVELLVQLWCHFGRFLRNFVSFQDFYNNKTAIFQAGKLFMDGRCCELVFPVETDVAEHAKQSRLSMIYLAYVECQREDSTRTVAAAFTSGDSDTLGVGRRGVFYDVDGNDWDAKVVRVIAHPISVREACLRPYKRMGQSIEDMLAKRAALSDADKLLKGDGKLDVGIVAALGVGLGAISATLGSLLQSFVSLGVFMPLGLVGIFCAISGPSMFIAWLKLRRRNLAPILEASGWAINRSPNISLMLGHFLTKRAHLPSSLQGRAESRRAARREFAVPALVATVFVALCAGAGVAWWKVTGKDMFNGDDDDDEKKDGDKKQKSKEEKKD